MTTIFLNLLAMVIFSIPAEEMVVKQGQTNTVNGSATTTTKSTEAANNPLYAGIGNEMTNP